MFAALERAGIRACALRDELESGELLGDLDLLVEEHRFPLALSVLQSEGYRVLTTERSVPFKSALVKWDDGAFVVLDVHRRLVQDGIVYMDAGEVLSRMRRKEGYTLPAEDDLLIILLIHNILGKCRIQDKHMPLLRDLRDRIGEKEMRTRISGRSGDVLASVLASLEEHHADKRLVEQVRVRLRQALLLDDPRARWRIRRRNWNRLLRRVSPKPRGPLYALIGPDGVGKSSLNRELLDLFNRQSPFRAISVYMGPWGHYRLPIEPGEVYVPGWSLTTREWFDAMISRPSGGRPSVIETLEYVFVKSGDATSEARDHTWIQRIRTQSRLYLTLRYLRSQLAVVRFFTVLALETVWRSLVIYKARRRGSIVLSDRYIYDVMTGRMHEVIPQYRRLREAFCRLVPRPTRVILLDVEPETILKRKNDLTPDTLTRVLAVYKDLASRYRFDRVKADASPATVAATIVGRLFDEIATALRK